MGRDGDSKAYLSQKYLIVQYTLAWSEVEERVE